MKFIKEMSSAELFEEMADKQKEDVYKMVWFNHVLNDAKGYMRDFYAEEELPAKHIDGVADKVAKAFVYDKDFDCTLNYWDNIDKLIDKFYTI